MLSRTLMTSYTRNHKFASFEAVNDTVEETAFEYEGFDSETALILQIDTTITDTDSTPSDTIAVEAFEEIVIDWGDGSATQGADEIMTHTYASGGVYDIRCFTVSADNQQTQPSRDNNNNLEDRRKYIDIKQFGNIVLQDSHFRNCSNMDITASDVPRIDSLTTTFDSCSISGNIQNLHLWDTSEVVNFDRTFDSNNDFEGIGIEDWSFASCQSVNRFLRDTNFNRNINSWDTQTIQIFIDTVRSTPFNNGKPIGEDTEPLLVDWSSAIRLIRLFRETPFNQEIRAKNGIDPPDTRNVENFQQTFGFQSAFSKDVSDWNTSKGSNFSGFLRSHNNSNVSEKTVSNGYGTYQAWDLQNATNLQDFFFTNTIFNNGDPPGESNNPLIWNYGSGVTELNLYLTSGVFAQDITSFDFTNISDAQNLFVGNGEYPTPLFDALLIHIDSHATLQLDVVIGFADSKFTPGGAAEAAYNNLINTYNWTINSGGPVT